MFNIRWRSIIATAVLVTGLMVSGTTGAFAKSYTVTGTLVSVDQDKQMIVMLTSDINGKEMPITIDMSPMHADLLTYTPGQLVSLEIMERESDTYLAVTQGTDLEWQDRDTQGGSIRARVGNVPDDDESLRQQHRNGSLKSKQDEDDGANSANDDSR